MRNDQGGTVTGRCVLVPALAGILALIASTLAVFVAPPPAAAVPIVTTKSFGRVDRPRSITPGPDGALWFTNDSDGQPDSIGRITADGVVTGLLLTDATDPVGIAAGPDGNLWFTSTTDNTVGRMTPDGVETLFTGAAVKKPSGIATGPDGNLWYTNTGDNSIGRITPQGLATSFTGPGIWLPHRITAGPDGNLWFTNFASNSIGRITPDGVVANFTGPGLKGPSGIVTGPDGSLWFTNSNASIGRITTAGVVTNFTGDGITSPSGITLGPDGNLWFTNYANNSIASITPTGTVTNHASPQISNPAGITTGPDGNLWFANVTGPAIGRMTTSGSLTSFVGLAFPGGVAAGPDGYIWVVSGALPTVNRVAPNGAMTTFTFPGPGLRGLSHIAAGADGNMWFTNNAGSTIGRITTQGVITTFTAPGVANPRAITGGPDGNVWFTNDNADAIGRIAPDGVITTFSAPGARGALGITGGPDGNVWFTRTDDSIGRVSPAGVVTNFTAAGIDDPRGIVTGPDGNLWFTAWNSHAAKSAVGRITPTGDVTMFVAPPGSSPWEMTAGPDGNLWFTNYWDDNTVGRFSPTGGFSMIDVSDGRSTTPGGISAGADGNVWMARNTKGSITRIDTGLPGAPTTVHGVPGIGQVAVSWVAPENEGASPVTGYTVTASPGGATCSWTGGPLGCTVTGLTNGVAYSFTVRASNAEGPGATSSPSASVTPSSAEGSGYHALTPARILDSRGPLGGWNGAVLEGAPRDVKVTGVGGVSGSAAAVVLNVTATNATNGSFLTAYPSGRPTPRASNLNFGAGQTIANLVTVKVGDAGKVRFANAVGGVDVVVDVVGYYDDGMVEGDLFNAVTPTRVLDSRTPVGGWAGPLAAGTPRELVVRQPGNVSGVPASASAVIANVTVTGADSGSFVSVWPAGLEQPSVSNLNFGVGQTIPNLAIVKIGEGGALRFANAVGAVDVVVDVVGYFDPTSGARFHAIDPTRVLDGRVPVGLPGPWGPAQTRALPVAGAAGTNVPAGANGMVANVTATGGTANSFLTVFPEGASVPTASNVNFGVGQTIPNLVTVGIPASGSIAIFNQQGNVDVVADAVGYYAPT